MEAKTTSLIVHWLLLSQRIEAAIRLAVQIRWGFAKNVACKHGNQASTL